jgi:hypothetical protein
MPWGRDGLAAVEIARSFDSGKRAKNVRAERIARHEAFSLNLGNGNESYMVTFDSKT